MGMIPIDKDKAKIETIEAIKKNTIIHLCDIFAFVTFSQPWFYAAGLAKDEEILGEIDKNKMMVRSELQKSFRMSTYPAEKIFLYKTLMTPKEKENTQEIKIDNKNVIEKEKTEIIFNVIDKKRS